MTIVETMDEIKNGPQLSLVMPCYNEGTSLRTTVLDLMNAFTKKNISLQLVLVDNGSTDDSSEIIDELIDQGYRITKVSIDMNRGYGHGIISGFARCEAPLIGFIHADGQLSGEEVIKIYRSILGKESKALAKAKRKYRKDGLQRLIISFCYNCIMLLFGDLGSRDINASPKIMSKENLYKMNLFSQDWFIDPEIMIKAKYLGLKIIEVEVQGQSRKGGKSNVRLYTCLEFFKNILIFSTGRPLTKWKAEIANKFSQENPRSSKE